jgi:hypothetical protein
MWLGRSVRYGLSIAVPPFRLLVTFVLLWKPKRLFPCPLSFLPGVYVVDHIDSTSEQNCMMIWLLFSNCSMVEPDFEAATRIFTESASHLT